MKATHPTWLPEKKFNILFQMGLSKHPELPDTPLIMDLAKTDEDRAIFKLIFGRQVMAWPFAAAARRAAGSRRCAAHRPSRHTMHDKEFLADAAKAKFEIRPVTGVGDPEAGAGDLRHARAGGAQDRGVAAIIAVRATLSHREAVL